jgi:hypothetical protein
VYIDYDKTEELMCANYSGWITILLDKNGNLCARLNNLSVCVVIDKNVESMEERNRVILYYKNADGSKSFHRYLSAHLYAPRKHTTTGISPIFTICHHRHRDPTNAETCHINKYEEGHLVVTNNISYKYVHTKIIIDMLQGGRINMISQINDKYGSIKVSAVLK